LARFSAASYASLSAYDLAGRAHFFGGLSKMIRLRRRDVHIDELKDNSDLLAELFFGNLEIAVIQNAFQDDIIEGLNQAIDTYKDKFLMSASQY
jgi:hypothetical protein